VPFLWRFRAGFWLTLDRARERLWGCGVRPRGQLVFLADSGCVHPFGGAAAGGRGAWGGFACGQRDQSDQAAVRAENLIHGSDQHSCSPAALPVMLTGHVPVVRFPHDHATSRVAAAVPARGGVEDRRNLNPAPPAGCHKSARAVSCGDGRGRL